MGLSKRRGIDWTAVVSPFINSVLFLTIKVSEWGDAGCALLGISYDTKMYMKWGGGETIILRLGWHFGRPRLLPKDRF